MGRHVRLLAEFTDQTQIIVTTHNPSTMQAGHAFYGVTMQEPGVSTIGGVRLDQMEPVYPASISALGESIVFIVFVIILFVIVLLASGLLGCGPERPNLRGRAV